MVEKTDIKFELENSRYTLKELFGKIGSRYPKIHEKICTNDNKLNSGILCIINNKIVIAEEINKLTINDNDEIIFSVAVAGG
jgi:molybdopterin converting factor small subunit